MSPHGNDFTQRNAGLGLEGSVHYALANGLRFGIFGGGSILHDIDLTDSDGTHDGSFVNAGAEARYVMGAVHRTVRPFVAGQTGFRSGWSVGGHLGLQWFPGR